MNLTSIDLLTGIDQSLRLVLRSKGSNERYIIKKSTGLDPDELIRSFYGTSADKKKRYNTLMMKKRVIGLLLELKPNRTLNESYSDVRSEMYKVISASRSGLVTLHFNSGSTTVSAISGFITKFEMAYFDKKPGMQITIDCQEKLLTAINPVRQESADISTGSTIHVPDSHSTAPHGFTFSLSYTAASPHFLMREANSLDWEFKVTPGTIGANTGFISGDTLIICTCDKTKKINLVRSAVTYPLLDKLDPTSIWPLIFPGSNQFYVEDSSKFDFNWTTYYPAYWGV